MDHANLLHYRHPQKVNRQVARYILTLADYNIEIHHHPGPLNRADALSRRPDYDKRKEDNTEVTPLPASLFADQLRTAILDAHIETDHKENRHEYAKLQGMHHWEEEGGLWKQDGCIAVLPDAIRKELLREHHDHPMAGHPGAATTYFSVRRKYWWPGLKDYVQQYVKGCATCQQNKTDTQKKKPPLFPIEPKKGANPFETIAMDWITKLPPSLEFNSILTITNHDCSKAVLLIPCKKAMETEDLAKIYYSKVFPHFGIPSKVISCYVRTTRIVVDR